MTPSSPVQRRRGTQQMRAIALWALGLALTLGAAALLAWAGVLLSIFGLAGVALALAAAMTAIGLTVWRRGMLPMAVLSAALVLPAAAVALGETRFERSLGLLTVRAQTPQDTAGKTYRRGSGPVFVDLRNLKARGGTTTRVKARADNGPIVVALPHDQCLDVTVRVRSNGNRSELAQVADSSLRLAGIDSGNAGGLSWGPQGLSQAAATRDEQIVGLQDSADLGVSYNLLVYGRFPIGMSRFGDEYVWTHPADTPGAPKVDLDLQASQQIIVRDYPSWAAPLTDGNDDGYEQVSSVSWPTNVRPPLSPAARSWATRMSVRTPENRARWIKWEREMVRFGIEQARRYAGPCATRQQLEDRSVWFQTQPETVRAPGAAPKALLGGPTTRHSAIPQPTVPSKYSVLSAEVNGLGKVKTTEVTTFNPEGYR